MKIYWHYSVKQWLTLVNRITEWNMVMFWNFITIGMLLPWTLCFCWKRCFYLFSSLTGFHHQNVNKNNSYWTRHLTIKTYYYYHRDCKKNPDTLKNWPLVKNPQFVSNPHETSSKWLTHEVIIFTKFHED